MADTSSWMTSFYWQQDLRSYYMNGLLNASLKAGVYNANIAAFVTKDTDTSTGSNIHRGLNLFIKKGTTFIFSNSYKSNSEGRIERDLDDTGTYLIKSFATKDTVVNLINIGEDNVEGNPKNSVFGVGEKREEAECYVVAYIKYNSESSSNQEEPSFACFVKNPGFDNTSLETACMRYFSGDGSTGSDNNASVYLPDGQTALEDKDKYIGYLILGAITPAGEWKSYLGASTMAWKDDSSASSWASQHTFIGRGLPDYRYSLASDTNGMSPDLLINVSESGKSGEAGRSVYDSVILDLRDSVLDGKVLSNTANIEDNYKWGGRTGVGGNALTTKIKKYTNSELSANTEGKYVICDLIYLSSKLKYSNLEDTLNTILEDSESCSLKDFSWISKYSSLDAFRVDTSTIVSNFYSSSATTRTSYSGTTIFDGGIVPLDISGVNQSRLLNIVKNKNILGPVINKIRHEDSDATSDTIIPVALIFRAFSVGSDKSITFGDKFTSGSEFNPANLLSFFDLQYKAHKINTLNANVNEVYSVLPTLE